MCFDISSLKSWVCYFSLWWSNVKKWLGVSYIFVSSLRESSLAAFCPKQQPPLPWQGHGLMDIFSILTLSMAAIITTESGPVPTSDTCPQAAATCKPFHTSPLLSVPLLFSSLPSPPLFFLPFLSDSQLCIMSHHNLKSYHPFMSTKLESWLLYIVNELTYPNTWGLIIWVLI